MPKRWYLGEPIKEAPVEEDTMIDKEFRKAVVVNIVCIWLVLALIVVQRFVS